MKITEYTLYYSLEGHFKPEVSPAPELQGISQNREFSVKGTKFLCYFQNLSKTPQKAFECYQSIEKAPQNSTKFLNICKKHP